MQDPDLAIRELHVLRQGSLGFKGSLGQRVASPMPATWKPASTTTCRNIVPWAETEKLDVAGPTCTRAIRSDSRAQIYKGAEWLLGPTWAFGQETAVHSLRLMGSGLFDKHPKLKIVIGHMR